MVLVRTHVDFMTIFDFDSVPQGVIIMDSYEMQLVDLMNHKQIQVM